MKEIKFKREIFYITIVQLVILIIINLMSYLVQLDLLETTPIISYIAYINIFILSILTIECFLTRRFFRTNIEQEYEIKKTSYESIKKLNMSLRIQRHDFINHMQVIYSLVQLKKNEEAQKYIKKLYGDIDEISDIPKTGNIPLDSLLQSKQRKAKERGIEIKFDIDSIITQLPVEPWEISSIFGNIIDNALDACTNTNKQDTIIKVDIWSNDYNFTFVVNNNCGPIITKRKLNKIFEPGFTTKKQDGNGLGLYIVKTIVDKYAGCIDVNSDRIKGTTFKVVLPFGCESIIN